MESVWGVDNREEWVRRIWDSSEVLSELGYKFKIVLKAKIY